MTQPEGTPENSPILSIVLGARDAGASLERCLQSLLEVDGIDRAQIVVAVYPAPDSDMLARFESVEFVVAEPACHVAALRALALSRARGDWIYLTEPFCTFATDLMDHLIEASRGDGDVIGGSVRMGPGIGRAAWASAFMEYAQFFEPLSSAFTEELTSNNVLYRREVLEPIERWQADGYWKYYAHLEFKQAGRRFEVQPERAVTHHPPYRFVEFMIRTFHHSRTFGAMRSRGIVFGRRGLWILRCGLIAPLFTFRLLSRCWSKREYRGRLIASLPIIFCYYTSWAVGEAWGTAFGTGSSAEKVY